MQLRPASIDDAAAIARVQVETWRAAYSEILSESAFATMTVPLRTERWRSNLQGDAATTFVAATDHVIGFASIGANRDGLDDDVSELFALYVLPEHWGRGYGWRLYDYAREHCCSASSALVLWVLDGNDRAIRFYERCGYALDGATKTIELGDRNYDESRMRCNFTG